MFTRVINLVLAAVTTLFAILDIVEFPPTFELVLFTVIAPCWFAGAIGLLFRHRLAWCASLLGVGTLLCSSLTMFASGIVLSPVAQDPTDGIGYMLIFGFIGSLLSLAVIIGLFRMRKDLFGSSRMPNKSPEPTAVGACRSAVAVHVAGRRWLSFFR
jgi:hypothetical protein